MYNKKQIIGKIGESWYDALIEYYTEESFIEYMDELLQEMDYQYKNNIIVSPKKQEVFRSLKLLPFNDVRTVILGKDPYPDPKNADGLAFSSRSFKTQDEFPRALKRIAKKVEKELPGTIIETGDLTDWVRREKILLLNRGLTYIEDEQDQRQNINNWDCLVEGILCTLNNPDIKKDPVYHIFWGDFAKRYSKFVPQKTNYHCSTHPSMSGRLDEHGFFLQDQFIPVDQFYQQNYGKKLSLSTK